MSAFIIRGEDKVRKYMDQILTNDQRENDYNDLRNTTTAKLRMLDKCKEDAKTACLTNIFNNVYKDACPLSDEYKNAYCDDLNKDFPNFLHKVYPKDLSFYIHEAIKKGSPFAKRVMEAVNELVDSEYKDKELNIDDVNPEELIFKTTDDIQKKLDVIKDDIGANDIAEAIRQNVKDSAISEITRAKREKEAIKSFEDQLKNDPAMTSPAAIESAVEKFDIKQHGFRSKFYTPTLFEAVMISKMNDINHKREVGEFVEMPLYNVMSEYKENVDDVTPADYAFVETLKEYTCISMLKGLKLESFTKEDIEELATMYSESKL